MSYHQYENICRYDIMVTYDKWILSLFFCLSAPASFFPDCTADQVKATPILDEQQHHKHESMYFPDPLNCNFAGLSTTHVCTAILVEGHYQMYILQHGRTAHVMCQIEQGRLGTWVRSVM